MKRYLVWTAAAAATAFLVAPAGANDSVLKLTQDPNQWVLQTGDYANTRYSKLKQITTDNVGKLQVAWPGAVGTRYQVQTSPDLGSWTDLGAPLDGSGQTLGVELPTGEVRATFVRVVTAPGS